MTKEYPTWNGRRPRVSVPFAIVVVAAFAAVICTIYTLVLAPHPSGPQVLVEIAVGSAASAVAVVRALGIARS